MNSNRLKGNNETKIDFLDQDFIGNPFPVYKDIREKDSVYRFLLPNGHLAWIITKDNDAVKILNDSRTVNRINPNRELVYLKRKT